MYGSIFSYVSILESPIWERSAYSVYHMFHLFTDITSCCDFLPLVYCGWRLGPIGVGRFRILGGGKV